VVCAASGWGFEEAIISVSAKGAESGFKDKYVTSCQSSHSHKIAPELKSSPIFLF
jgi:hypothetical protein